MTVPTLEDMVDAMDALKTSCEAGKWTLLAPDGRMWMSADPNNATQTAGRRDLSMCFHRPGGTSHAIGG